MRLKTVLVAGALLALAASSDAWAQGRGRGGFGRFGNNVTYMGLLRVDAIQEAVKVTDDQDLKLDEARDELNEAAQAARGEGGGFGNFQDLSDEEREQALARFRELAAQRATAEKAKVAEILDEAQMKRLGEIFIQVAGSDALSDADVAAALKITDDQKEKIQAAQQEARTTRFQELQDLEGEERTARLEELRKEADTKIVALLTADQQKQFEDMKGETLELSEEDLNRARRGGGRGFGRGGGGGGRGGRGGRGGDN
jgi:hypothetical protein